MRIRRLFKDSNSNGGDCPAVYETDGDDFIVQGWALDGDTAAQLVEVGADETAVRIPRNVAEQLAAHLR